MSKGAVNYTAPGPVAEAFFASNARRRFLLGPVGSGKSVACCMEILRRSMEQKPNAKGERKTRWAVIRNTYPELKLTTLETWRDWFNDSLGKFHHSPPYQHTLDFPMADGTRLKAEVIFLALDKPDDVKKLLSLELTGAWFNECREIPKVIIDGIDGGRIGRYPSKKDGGPSWFGIIGDTNMPDEDHWLHNLCEIEKPDGWEFFRQPGGVVRRGDKWVVNPNAENIKNLPDTYYSEGMSGKSPGWIRVYYAAQWGFIQDGKPVFPEYSEDLHYCETLVLAPRLPLILGVDFGLTPAAILCQKDAYGNWNAIDELVTAEMGAIRFGEALQRKLRGEYAGTPLGKIWTDPAGSQRNQVNEQTPIEALRACGLPAQPCPGNNKFVERREAVAVPMGRLVEGRAGFRIGPKCIHLKRAMAGGYRFKRVLVTGEERYQDSPEKNAHSHPAEALQYAMLGEGEGVHQVMRARGNPAKSFIANHEWDPFSS